MSNYFLVLLAVAVRLWPEGRFWPPAPMVKAEAAPAVAVAKLSREESHSLQAATTLSTSSAEPPTLREALGRRVQEGNQGHLGSCGEGGHELALLVQDEGGGHRRVAGQVQHLQCSLDHHVQMGPGQPPQSCGRSPRSCPPPGGC